MNTSGTFLAPIAVLILALAACGTIKVTGNPDTGEDPDAPEDTDSDSDASMQKPPIDVLLVLHTTREEAPQYISPLVLSFPHYFVFPLTEAGFDVRVGILSADMGTSGYVIERPPGISCPECGTCLCDREDGTSSSDEGLLTAWPPCWPENPEHSGWLSIDPPGCGPFTLEPPPEGWPRWMEGSDPRFEDWLHCFGNRWDGCAVPQPLESLYQALEPDRNPGFLRDESILAVLILTAQDDCSTGNPIVFDDDQPVAPIISWDKCAYWSEQLYPLNRYVSRILEVRSRDRLAVAVYAGPDEEYTWCEPEDCTWCSEVHPCLRTSECVERLEYTVASPRLHEFARLLGSTPWGSPVGISEESCPAIYMGGSGTSIEAAFARFREAVLDRVR